MELLTSHEYMDVISWIPNGAAFIIYKKKKFSTEVLPKFFKQSKFTSFTRKLNRWGFIRITRGPQTGSYFHKLFHRDQPELCLQMRCQNVTMKSKMAPAAATTAEVTTTTTSPTIRALLSRPDTHANDFSRRHPTLSTTQGSSVNFNTLPFNASVHNGHLSSSLMGLGVSSSLTGMTTNTNSSLSSNPIALMQINLQLQQLQQQQQQTRLQLQQQQQHVHKEMLRRAMASQASANATRAQLMMGTNINMFMPPPTMNTLSKDGLTFLQMLGLQKSQASSMSAQPLIQAMQRSLLPANQMKSDLLLGSSTASSLSSGAKTTTVTNNLSTIDPDQGIKRASAA
jgi:hypothetical protein